MNNLLAKTKKLIMLSGDIVCLYLSLYLTLLARYGCDDISQNWERHLYPFSLIFTIWLIIFFINDLYDLKISYNTSNLISNLVRVSILNALAAVIIFYFFGRFLDTIRPQRVLLIEIGILFVVLFIWRKLFYHSIKSSKIANRVLILSQSPLSAELEKEISRRPQLGYQAIYLTDEPENLKDYCLEHNIDILVSAGDFQTNQSLAKKIFNCLSLGIDFYNTYSFYEQITNKIPVEYIKHEWFLDNLTEHSKKVYEIIKRLTDIFFAIVGLTVTLPLMPIISLIIKLDSPGPIIFKQVRTGKNGKEFLAMKFRSMVRDAERDGAQWAQKNDSRITRFGSIMRKTRLDEIPQLINILRGEMSLIGPRPERPEFIRILEQAIPFYRERLIVKPGLAGWAQLKGPAYGGSQEESLEKLKYDLYYIKNRSLILDITILLKTIKVVVSGRGQ